MAEVRVRVALIEDPKPLESKAKIIWSVLQCHMSLQRFILLRFQGHPVIMNEITMLMETERVDPEELVSMEARLVFCWKPNLQRILLP
jgi:hypothetical protein